MAGRRACGARPVMCGWAMNAPLTETVMKLQRTLVMCAVAGLAALVMAQQSGPGGQGPAGAGAEGREPSEKKPDLMGRVAGISGTGRQITVVLPPRGGDGQPITRDAKPEEVRVTLTDKTRQQFFGVEEGEAVPAPGLMVMVWFEEGSRDTAARVRFMKREGEQRPDVQGRVVGVSQDGRTITVETREFDRETGKEKVLGKMDVRIAPYTHALYFGVEPGGAKPTVDYLVVGWFEKGSKDTAARIRFMKN